MNAVLNTDIHVRCRRCWTSISVRNLVFFHKGIRENLYKACGRLKRICSNSMIYNARIGWNLLGSTFLNSASVSADSMHPVHGFYK